jgi:aminopeptidase-like protein
MLYTPDFIKTPQIINYRIIAGDDGVDTVLPAIAKIKQNFQAIAEALDKLEQIGLTSEVIDLGTL